jgi:hypothetical protein
MSQAQVSEITKMIHTGEFKAEDAAQVISAIVNVAGLDHRKIAQLMARDHPTLQESKMRVVVSFIEEMAKVQSDGRNEAAVQFAQKVMSSTDARDRAMPYI